MTIDPDDVRRVLGPIAARPAVAAAIADIGRPGSRWRLPTPALVVDLDALEANIALMVQRARDAGIGLRPHAKSHKSAYLARLQIAAGARGVCCAKLGEAEALADAGVPGLLVTSPVAGELAFARAAELAARVPGFMIVVDHPTAAEGLGAAAAARGVVLDVVIDVDVGLGRTGAESPQAAARVAATIAALPSLRLRGIQGYGGQWQHMTGAQARRAATEAGMARLTDAIAALRGEGHAVEIVTGGGTGTFAADAALGVMTEVQVGSYLFMDRQYRDALDGDADGAFATSLFVQAQVISANHPDWVTVDAGLKAMATDGPLPRPTGERFGASSYRWFGDEHGMITRPPGKVVQHGERVELETPHCDPTVDRYDAMYFVRCDNLEHIQPIDGRGRSQ